MRAVVRLALAAAAAGVGVVVAAGCTNFPREDRIEDMRVLAIKTEPAEILYSPLFLTPAAQRPPGFPLPSIDVNVEVFAFDPRGGHVKTTTQLCPAGAGDSTCRLYDPTADLAAEPAAARPDIEALLTQQTVEGDIASDATPVGRVQPSTFTMHFSPAVMDFFIPDASDGTPTPSIFPLLPRFVVQEDNTDADPATVVSERAFKRIPISLDLTSADLPPDVVANLARGLGIELCAAPIPDSEFDKQGRASCLERRVPNNNPGLVGFRLEPDPANLTPDTATDDVVQPDVGVGSVLGVKPGDTIALTPVFTADSVERYQVVSFDVETSKIILLNRVEDLACNWYTTRGNTQGSLTALQFGATLGNVWTLPADAQPGERDSIVMVVLDQRGGTAVGEITVEYQ